MTLLGEVGFGLIEVVWEVLPGKVFGFGAAEIEFYLCGPRAG